MNIDELTEADIAALDPAGHWENKYDQAMDLVADLRGQVDRLKCALRHEDLMDDEIESILSEPITTAQTDQD